MSLAPYVAAVSRGPNRGRPLTRQEAAEALTLVLSGQAEPEAVGALLMVLRYRGETAAELAGFVDALRGRLDGWPGVDAGLDWPSYAAGRTRGLPLFLLSARLVAAAGVRVFLHGWNSHQEGLADVRSALPDVGIPMANSAADAEAALAAHGIVYAPLEAISEEALAVLRLRQKLGLRSIMNTVLRMFNPTGASCAVQGVFHPPYRLLQRDAAELLGQPNLTVFKGGGGEFERHPAKGVDLFGLRDGKPMELIAEPLLDEKRRLADPEAETGQLDALWHGRREDPFDEAVIVGTAAVALFGARLADDLKAAEHLAADLWRSRSGLAAA